MAHRRVKDVDYDSEEDYYDDEDDSYYTEATPATPAAPTMSAEDQASMRDGVAAVRDVLGGEGTEGAAVSNKEIEESLWYYYFDVEKTVAYLLKQHTPKQEKQTKQKTPSKFDQAASAALNKTPIASSSDQIPPTITDFNIDNRPTKRARLSATSFFADTPWLNVPHSRLGNITVQPIFPSGRLLGGSSKPPSKLAALAAARKKAAEEKKQKVAESANEDVVMGDTEGASSSAMFDRLSALKKHTPTDPSAPLGVSKKDAAFALPVRTYPGRPPKPASPEPTPQMLSPAPVEESVEPARPQGPTAEELTATPSTFAQTMLGGSTSSAFSKSSSSRNTSETSSLFTLPYPEDIVARRTKDPFAGPSPDDVVLKAQQQAKGTSTPSKKSNTNNKTPTTTKSSTSSTSTNDVTKGVKSLQLDDAATQQQQQSQTQTPTKTKTLSKNLNVAEEFKKANVKNAANFVVIGHVDHGKSTLMGRLLYDLKHVSDRDYTKLARDSSAIGKSSFAFAWVMDSTEEERTRGITVDIATNTFSTARTNFTILDAPGHRDFIPNMIAGASQADFAVLVVDASTNAFEAGFGSRGQTREHALLVRSMGIARVVVAVNKMDATSPKWSRERFDEVKSQMEAFLVGAGFKQTNVSVIPVAGLTGENVTRKVEDENAAWYQGRTLIEELDASEPSARAISEPLRMTIADVFRGGVTNPLSISGRLDAGNIQIGDVIQAMPASETAVVKAIDLDNEPVDYCVAGQIATLHLSDIDPVHLRPGDIICSPANEPIQNVKSFTAKILAFEHVTPGWVDVHRGRLHTPAKVAELLAVLGKSGEVEKKRPRVVKPGSLARVKVVLERALPLDKGARVVVRSEGSTLAAGLVESVDV